MKNSRKLAFAVLGALVGTAANAGSGAISYSYLSGGVVSAKSGWNRPLADFFEKGTGGIVNTTAHPKALTGKRSSLGADLQGSYDIGDGLFLQAKVGYLSGQKSGYFVGVGYHLPVTDSADFYVVGGISQPALPAQVRFSPQGKTLAQDYPRQIAWGAMEVTPSGFDDYCERYTIISPLRNTGGNTVAVVTKGSLFKTGSSNIWGKHESFEEYAVRMGCNKEDIVAALESDIKNALEGRLAKAADESVLSLKSKVAPTLEVGYRIRVNEQFGGRLAYRSSYDSVRIHGKLFNPIHQKMMPIPAKKRGLSHEATVEADYAFTANLLTDMSYTMSKMFKIESIKPKTGHRFNLGLRYVL